MMMSGRRGGCMRFFHASAPLFIPFPPDYPPTFPPLETPLRPAQSHAPARTKHRAKGSTEERSGVLVLSGQDCGVRPKLTALSDLNSGVCPSAFQTAPCTTP